MALEEARGTMTMLRAMGYVCTSTPNCEKTRHGMRGLDTDPTKIKLTFIICLVCLMCFRRPCLSLFMWNILVRERSFNLIVGMLKNLNISWGDTGVR